MANAERRAADGAGGHARGGEAGAVEIVDGIRTGDAEKSLFETMELARRRMRAEDAWFEGKPDDLSAILYRPQSRPIQPRRRK